jgi:hypothetical protein
VSATPRPAAGKRPREPEKLQLRCQEVFALAAEEVSVRLKVEREPSTAVISDFD